ncbi:hypothetical protein [Jannaschia donghaensis]|uniref:hypothetical protein n=1 Tax=Jannaschia donghaensis TaxID=420998 RepID=UPI0011873279|nr:hypothetical protein [Jannaschia donghaensis]
MERAVPAIRDILVGFVVAIELEQVEPEPVSRRQMRTPKLIPTAPEQITPMALPSSVTSLGAART